VKPLSRATRLLLVLAVVLVVVAGLARLRVDNAPAAFLGDSPGLAAHLANYGPDHAVRVVVLGGDAAARAAWLDLADPRASAVPGVVEVIRAQRLRWLGQEPLVGALALEHDEASAMLVRLADAPAPQMRRTLATLRAALPAPGALDLVVAGLPVIDAELDQASRSIALRQFPLLVLLAGGTLWWWLRPRRHLLAPLVVVAGTLAVVFAGLGWLGIAVDLVVAVLLPLLFALALATTLHVVVRWRAAAWRGEALGAVAATYRELRWSLLWSGVTTAIGFASLTFAPLAPIRHFGGAAAAGVALLTVLVFTVLRGILARLDAGSTSTAQHRRLEVGLEQAGRGVAAWACRHPRGVVGGALLLAAVAGAGLDQLRVESDASRYFPADHPVRRDGERLERLGMPLAAVNVVVDGAPPPVEAWRNFQGRLAEHELVLAVAGPGSLTVPRDPLLFAQAAQPFIGRETTSSRALVGVRLSGFEGLDGLRSHVVRAARETLGDRRVEVTGSYAALLDGHRQLLATLVWSLVTTVGSIALVLLVLLRRFSTALAVLVPNLWPVLVVFGAMGWLGVPLDVATVMVGAIVVGIAVDDSLHILGGLRRTDAGGDLEAALVATVGRAAPAFALTTLLLVLGFGICATASFLPTQRFGLTAAAALLLALVADVVLLPALLVLGQKRGVRGSTKAAGGSMPR
jgi:predicted RND superfamily exporter protein